MKEEKYNTEQKENVWPLRARRRGLSAVRGEKKMRKCAWMKLVDLVVGMVCVCV